jgi:hypothetical protein
MPRKPTPQPDNPEQFKRFVDLARDRGADQPSENFDRVLDKIVERDPQPPKPKRSK